MATHAIWREQTPSPRLYSEQPGVFVAWQVSHPKGGGGAVAGLQGELVESALVFSRDLRS